jgi:hypothetical protein
VTSADGAAASWSRIARRTTVFHLPNLLFALLVVAGAITVDTALAAQARELASVVLGAALYLTARRHNGWAALHDLASGTRVVSRSAVTRRVGTTPEEAPASLLSVSARLRYGPFTVASEAGDDAYGLIVGFDPVLRRNAQ